MGFVYPSCACANLLLRNHRQYDIRYLSRQPLPLVLIFFVTLLQYKDEHLQHLKQTRVFKSKELEYLMTLFFQVQSTCRQT